MIVLNSFKELVQVDEWSSILCRPGFTQNLDPKAHTLSAIIGSYAFKDKIHCGLSNCHTPHNKGYIAVTTEGLETNMGTVCGKSYFGVDFETLSRRFDEDIQEKRDRDSLWTFSFKLDEFKQRIADLRSRKMGADWAYKALRPLADGTRDLSEVSRKIGAMLRIGTSDLTKEREATEREIDMLEMAQGKRLGRPHFIEDTVATIAGMDALYKENDLKTLLVLDLEVRIQDFESANIDVMTRAELRTFAKWVGSTDTTFDRAVNSLGSARRFLTVQNLRPFLQVISEDAGTAFATFLKKLDSYSG